MFSSRTILVALTGFIGSAVARWGFDVNAELLADAMMLAWPAAMAFMRSITRTPLGAK